MDRRSLLKTGAIAAAMSVLSATQLAAGTNAPTADDWEEKIDRVFEILHHYQFDLGDTAEALGYVRSMTDGHDVESYKHFSYTCTIYTDFKVRIDTLLGINDELVKLCGEDYPRIIAVLGASPREFQGRTLRDMITGYSHEIIIAHRTLISKIF